MIKPEVSEIAAEIIDIAWKSAEETDWKKSRAVKAARRLALQSPDFLSSRFIGLSNEEQLEVLELVLRELQTMRAPHA